MGSNARPRYEVIPSKRWCNAATGQTASIYGAVPYTSNADKPNWAVETVGWTWRDNVRGTVGLCRVPAKTEAEAQAVADELNARQR